MGWISDLFNRKDVKIEEVSEALTDEHEMVMIETTTKAKGDTDFHVFLAQCALAYKDFHFNYINNEKLVLSTVGIDGIFGDRTQTAIEAYQLVNGLEITGELDVATIKSLFTDGGLNVEL